MARSTLPRSLLLAGAVALALVALAGAAEPPLPADRIGPTGSIADPWARALADAVRSGRATPARHRALYSFLVDDYPYDRVPAADTRARAVAAHRANLAARPRRSGSGFGSAESSWISLGPTNVPGRMTGLALHPTDPNVLWAGGADGGLWTSVDGGASWRPIGDFEPTLSIGDVVVDPADPSRLWAATGEGNFASDNFPGEGILRSTDGGESWALAPLSDPYRRGIRRLDLDPSDHATLLAAANGGLIRSTDAGVTWALVDALPNGDWMFATDIVRDPTDPAVVYVAMGDVYARGAPDSIGGIWKSTDRGTTWTALAGGFPSANVGRIALAIAPTDPNVLYAGVHRNTNDQLLGLFRSTDAGGSWQRLATAPDYCSRQCWYDDAIAIDPANPKLVYVGGLDVYRTTNGVDWTKVSIWSQTPGTPHYVHADQHRLVAPRPNEIWSASDGGIARSTDAGATWTGLDDGLVTSQFYGLADPGEATQPALGGLQDNGTLRFDGDPEWLEVYGGDGGATAVDPTNPNVMFTEYVYLSIAKSLNAGASWRDATRGIASSDRALFIAPFEMDPADPKRMLAGTFRAYLTTNQAGSWIPISDALTASDSAGYVAALAFDPNDPARVWAGTTDGNLQRGDGVGAGTPTWTNLAAAPLPSRSVRAIAPDPTDPDRIFVGYSGYDSQTPDTPGHLFRTSDGGATWTNVTGPLPDQPVRTIVADPDTPGTVYAGCDLGVYVSYDAGDSWAPLGRDLPFVAVFRLTLNRSLHRLRAATHGRGVWEIELPTPTPVRTTVVPVAAHVAGANGTEFRTDLVLTNLGDATATATLAFTPAGAAPIERTVQVPPRAVARLGDVVLATFGLGDAFGRLVVRSTAHLLVAARVFNQAPDGTFGQAVPGLDAEAAAIGPGQGPLHLVGLESSTALRTNVGVAEVAGRTTSVSIRIVGDDGALLGERSLEVGGGELIQIGDLLTGLARNRDGDVHARAELRVDSGGAVVAYASIVDAVSGDAVYVPARALGLDNQPRILPAAAHAPGVGGSTWTTDLVVTNPGATELAVDLAFLPAGSDGSAAPRTTVNVAPGATVRLADVVATLAPGTDSAAGAIWIEPDPAAPLIAWARIATASPSGGSFGQFVEARSPAEATAAGGVATLPGVVSTAEFRTNAGFVNPTGAPATLAAVLRDQAGTELRRDQVTIAPYSATFVGGWGDSDLAAGRLDVEVGAGSVLAWISVVDNRTNDPTLVPSSPVE